MKKAIYMGIGKEKDDHIQRVFMVDPPLEGNEFVLVSARDIAAYFRSMANAMRLPPSALGMSEYDTETYIFGCDSAGNIHNWRELEGSFKGEMNIARALQNAGYEIVESMESK